MMWSRIRARGVVVAAWLTALAPWQAVACGFHAGLPEKSLFERIAESASLVAARPTPQSPFSFASSRLVRGVPTSSSPPHLVDTATRHRLEAAPDHAVLFAQGADGTWSRLLLLDEATRPVIEEMVTQADRWTRPDGKTARRDFAAGLLEHPDPRIRRIALRELDSLDYATLRGGAYQIRTPDLLAGIENIQEQAYAPIRILLIGLAGGETATAETARQFRLRAASGSALNLGAWTTAAVEAHGSDGVAFVESVLADLPRPLSREQTAEIVRAFALQSASGGPALHAPIRAVLLRLVARDPDAAPLIAPSLVAASDRAQTALVRELLSAGSLTTRNDLIAAAAYLTFATEAPDAPDAVASRSRALRSFGAQPPPPTD
jgi:hypothetical protein